MFVHPELVNLLALSLLLSFVLIVGYTISSLNCSLFCGITYQFFAELVTVVCCIVSTPNLWQNPSVLHYLSSFVVSSWSLLVEVLCILWQYVLLCHIWNILVVSFLSLVISNLLPCVWICYSYNTWICILVHYFFVVLFPLVCPFLYRLFLNLSCSCSRCWSTHIVTNFIWPYFHQFFDGSHGLNGPQKPFRRPFDRYKSRLEAINIGWAIEQSVGNHYGTTY